MGEPDQDCVMRFWRGLGSGLEGAVSVAGLLSVIGTLPVARLAADVGALCSDETFPGVGESIDIGEVKTVCEVGEVCVCAGVLLRGRNGLSSTEAWLSVP